MEWIELNSNSCENNLQNYLLVLYRNQNLVLFDAEFGQTVWSKRFTEDIRSMSLDPFCRSNVLFAVRANDSCFATVSDLRPEQNRSPNRPLKHYTISAANNSPKNNGSLSKYTLSVKSEASHPESNVSNECIQICFHRAVRHQVLVAFNREVLVADLSIEAIICCVPLERNCTNITNIFSCLNRNAFYVCHDFGTVSLRLFQKHLTTDPNEGTTRVGVGYVNLCQSDGLRLIKQNKIFGYCMAPTTETEVALLLNNGRLVVKKVHKLGQNEENGSIGLSYVCDIIAPEEYAVNENSVKNKNYRILMTHLFPALNCSPHVIRMCPAVTLRNWPIHRPLLAVGDSSGTIQIWNVLHSVLERELSIHSFPVRGIEWTGLDSFISFAFPNISPHSGNTNNELNIIEVNSGRTHALRTERNSDSSAIEALRISHLKQYLIILLKEDPFEIWDLRTLTLLRVMPKQFCAITAIEWSPLYNRRIQTNDTPLSLPSKENFVVTNTSGELYHFSVEGTVVKEITCIPPDTEMSANITCIAWKSDQVLLGDAIGNINVWDLKKKVSRIEPTHRGPIKKIRFGPGRGNMKFLLQYSDGVDMWDVKDFKLNAQLKSPRDMTFKVMDIDWASSDRPILATSEATIVVTDMKLRQYTSPMAELLVEDRTESDDMCLSATNFHLLSRMSRFIFRSKLVLNRWNGGPKLPDCDVERNILVSKLFHDMESYNFWNIVSYVMTDGPRRTRLDRNDDIFLDNNQFRDIECEKVSLLDAIRSTYTQNKICYEMHVTLNQPQKAVHLLLETDPSFGDYYADALRACLIASLQSKTENSSAHPIIKLVATNLIASGRVDEGSQLLCLIGKTQDACRYLQSANKWLESVFLAKCTLTGDEYVEVMKRWADQLTATDPRTAVLVFISIKHYLKAIQILHKFDIEKAVLFSTVCIKRQVIDVEENKAIFEQLFDKYSKNLENSCLEDSIRYYKELFKIY